MLHQNAPSEKAHEKQRDFLKLLQTQNSSSEVTALSKLYENPSLRLSICTHSHNSETFVSSYCGEGGGNKGKTACYCSVWLHNTFNLHGAGTLHNKTLQLPEITYSQHQQNPFSKGGNTVFKDLICPTQHRNSPKYSWKLSLALLIPHPKWIGSMQEYQFSWNKESQSWWVSSTWPWALKSFCR